MPNTKSAKKALRQTAKRKTLNLKRKSALKTSVKGFHKILKEKGPEEAKKNLAEVYKTVDKLGKVGFIKKGKANRIKSRLTKSLQTKKSA